MALSDFWRGGRDRSRNESDWRARDDDRSSGRPNYLRDEQGFQRRGTRQGSDYYGNNPERYGDRDYGSARQQGDDFTRGPEYRGSENEWRGFNRNQSDYGNPRGESEFNDRWQNAYGQSGGSNAGSRNEQTGYRYEGQDRDDARWWNERAGRPGGEMFTAQSGEHRGRGPRGYRRSDERIHEDVCECLTDDDSIDATNIQVSVKECEVTLSGSVNSRFEKRRAEDLIEQLSGVKDVHNTLRVVNEGGLIEGGKSGAEQKGGNEPNERSGGSQTPRH